jgi:uncharacterized protein
VEGDLGVSVETLTFTTADDVVLEGDLALPEGEVVAGVLLTHPHPQMGGDRHALLTSELFRLVPPHGVVTLRFDFRGAGASGGHHAGGPAEVRDVAAALDVLAERAPGLPLVIAGWSFGADVALSLDDERIAGWFAVGPPFHFGTNAVAHDPRPKLLAIPEHDQYVPPGSAEERTRGWECTTIEVIGGADHLCAGRTDQVADLLLTFLRDLPDR